MTPTWQVGMGCQVQHPPGSPRQSEIRDHSRGKKPARTRQGAKQQEMGRQPPQGAAQESHFSQPGQAGTGIRGRPFPQGPARAHGANQPGQLSRDSRGGEEGLLRVRATCEPQRGYVQLSPGSQPHQCNCSSKGIGPLPRGSHGQRSGQRFTSGTPRGRGQALLSRCRGPKWGEGQDIGRRVRLFLARVLPPSLQALSGPWGLGPCTNGEGRGRRPKRSHADKTLGGG